MNKNGINIESHTVNHKSMTDLTDDELRSELVDSKKKAESELGHAVNYVAYPTGTYNLHIAQMVKEAGYKAAFTIKYDGCNPAALFSGSCPSIGTTPPLAGLQRKNSMKNGRARPVSTSYAVKLCHHQS
jgi:peptidoglycan/xylan/chitin deacetylase (PgdA/CDA1 family)